MGSLLLRVLKRLTGKKKQKGKEFLKQVNILSNLTDDELDHVWSIVKEVQVPSGYVIMSEGEIEDSMFFFAQGVADVTKTLTIKLGKTSFGNVDKSMVKLDSAYVSFFGDMALFEEEPRSATITASSPCLLYEIKRSDFEILCQQNSELGLKILRQIAEALCNRIRKGNKDILKLSTALSIALSK